MSFSRKAREATLRLLFQWEMSKETPERVKELYWTHSQGDEAVRPLADELFGGVVERVEAIDRLIHEHSEHWRLERLSAVDRNILRLAVGEFLTRPEVPHLAVISEALALAHRYSADESAGFINGVLEAIRRKLSEAPPDRRSNH